jgi:SAM-dependent methyltransferase
MGVKQHLSGYVSRRSRARKLELLRSRIAPGSSVLLVGVSVLRDGSWTGTENFVERGLAQHANATALVYDEQGEPDVDCPFVRGSALDLPFDDNSFDYVVSNAVIEHVGGPEAARQMVAESRRVARLAAFHTTPYRWFPIETHTQIPLAHWLPRGWQQPVFARLRKPYFNGRDYWLFGRRDFARACPGGQIHHAGAITLIGQWPAAQPNRPPG